MQACRVERPFGAQPLVLETGKFAKQAHGAVVVRYGETVTLTPPSRASRSPGRDFFPLPSITAKRSTPPASFPAASSNAKAGPPPRKS